MPHRRRRLLEGTPRDRYVLVLVLISVFVISGSCDPAVAEGWPTYRHDAARSGVTVERVVTPLSLRWHFQPVHSPKPAWPKPAEELPRMHLDSAYHVTIDDGTVYFGSSMDHTVYAVRTASGKVRWTFVTEGPVRYAPTVWNGHVYVGSDDGYVYCLKARNGSLVWKYRAGPRDDKVLGNGRMISLWPVRTGVLVEDGVAYFGAGVFPYEGVYICALNAEDGSVVWKNDTIGDRGHELRYGGITPQSYLVASQDRLYVPSGRAMPAAFDRKSGEFLYYCSPGGKVGGSWALLDGDRLIAGVEQASAPAKIAYDAATGRRRGDAYAWFSGFDLALTSDVAYVVTEHGVHAIDRERYPAVNARIRAVRKERQELRDKLDKLRKALPVAEEQTVKGVDSTLWSKVPICEQIDETISKIGLLLNEEGRLKSTACKWEYPRKGFCTIILAGGLIVAGGNGTVVALDAETGEAVATQTVEGNALGLAACDGHLLVSTDRGNIYCFGKKRLFSSTRFPPPPGPSPYRTDTWMPVYEAAAKAIVRETGITKGYCLVLDCGTGRLAYELAKQTQLNIVGIEHDPEKIAMARERLAEAGLYGSRVVVEPWDLSTLPDYFANLIVSDAMVSMGETGASPQQVFRVLKPCGGMICFGQPNEAGDAAKPMNVPDVQEWLTAAGGLSPEVSRGNGIWAKARRGALEGAGSWTHLYGNPANTGSSDDRRVQCPLGVLWFGEPGPDVVVERHARTPSSLAMNGRFFIQGEESIRAYDAYNGLLLWQKKIPGAVRARADVDSGNLALTDDALYVGAHDKCYRLDPATGEIVRTYAIPPAALDGSQRWGYTACTGKILLGSTAMPLRADYGDFWKKHATEDGTWIPPEEVPPEYRTTYEYITSRYPEPGQRAREALHRGGVHWRSMTKYPSWGSQKSPKGAVSERMMYSDAIFALDTETGNVLWVHRAEAIGQITATIGDGAIFFAETAASQEATSQALYEKQKLIADGVYEEHDGTDLRPEDRDVRRVVALDLATGSQRWEKHVDLTGCGGEKMGAAYHDGVLVFFGHFSNHDRGFFRDGDLRWRRITALSAKTGETAWSRPLNYLRRPLIIGEKIIIEPRACDVHTGKIQTREHPITGQPVPWEFLRPGHSCGIISGAPNAIFYRSDSTAFVDTANDTGLTLFGGVRGGCWLDFIPANGLLLFPEGSSGCTCSYPIRCSVAFKCREPRTPHPWTIFITHGPMTPARRFAVNLGAPGDMKADDGTVWFGYPRPRTSFGVKLKLNDRRLRGMGYFCSDFRGSTIAGTDKPWLFASGCLGLQRCDVPLIDDLWGEQPGVYTVRLGFAAPSGDRAGQRVFDVKLQGKPVLRDFDVLREAGAPQKAVVREFEGIAVENGLTIEFVSKAPNPAIAQAPIVNFIEAVRADTEVAEPVPEPVERLDEERAQAQLDEAKAELGQGNAEAARGMYHAVLTAGPTVALRRQALDGLAAVASPKSLSKIAAYWRDTDPILWDYKEMNPVLRDGALQAYVAIARNMAEQDKRKGAKMLAYALQIADSIETYGHAAEGLEALGIDVGADASKEGYVTRWHVIGPFPWNARHSPLDKVFVGEPDVDFRKSYTVDGRILKWNRLVSAEDAVDLGKLLDPDENVCAYAYGEVLLPSRQDLLLQVDTNDGCKCWFNGEVVGSSEAEWKLDSSVLKVRGRAGANAILLKLSQAGGGWSFSTRLSDLTGKPIQVRSR